MNPEDTAMRAYYAARAAEYDRVYLKPERQADLRQIEAWLPTVFANTTALEVACGTGYWTQFIAPRCASVVAVDASLETLLIAKARVPQPKVSWVRGDAYQLPVAPTAFNAGFAAFWWSHIPKSRISEFLRGFHAALVPGSRVVFLDNRFVAGSSTPISEVDADGNGYQQRPLSDGTVHRVLKNFPSPDELLASVAGVAQQVRYREWDYFWALEYVTPKSPTQPPPPTLTPRRWP